MNVGYLTVLAISTIAFINYSSTAQPVQENLVLSAVFVESGEAITDIISDSIDNGLTIQNPDDEDSYFMLQVENKSIGQYLTEIKMKRANSSFEEVAKVNVVANTESCLPLNVVFEGDIPGENIVNENTALCVELISESNI